MLQRDDTGKYFTWDDYITTTLMKQEWTNCLPSKKKKKENGGGGELNVWVVKVMNTQWKHILLRSTGVILICI